MTILLTNDDGYQSEGLAVLESYLARAGHEIWVCAPTGQRSASSHSMTLRGEITITEYASMHYHCDGTPSDCVLYAHKGHLFPHQPDLVVSGINHGYNISTDILYSGTVGAASEAAIMGLKGLAISCMRDDDGDFPFVEAASFLVSHLEAFMPLCSDHVIVNINVPPHCNGNWKAGAMSFLEYHDAVETCRHSEDHVFDGSGARFGSSIVFSLKGGIPPEQRFRIEGTDFQAVSEGFVSVSALSVLPPVNREAQDTLVAMSTATLDV